MPKPLGPTISILWFADTIFSLVPITSFIRPFFIKKVSLGIPHNWGPISCRFMHLTSLFATFNQILLFKKPSVWWQESFSLSKTKQSWFLSLFSTDATVYLSDHLVVVSQTISRKSMFFYNMDQTGQDSKILANIKLSRSLAWVNFHTHTLDIWKRPPGPEMLNHVKFGLNHKHRVYPLRG